MQQQKTEQFSGEIQVNIISKFVGAATILSAILLFNANALGQEQVLAEVGAAGVVDGGNQGVVKPDFADKHADVDFTSWVGRASRNIVAMAISPKGSVLVLNGTSIGLTFTLTAKAIRACCADACWVGLGAKLLIRTTDRINAGLILSAIAKLAHYLAHTRHAAFVVAAACSHSFTVGSLYFCPLCADSHFA